MRKFSNKCSLAILFVFVPMQFIGCLSLDSKEGPNIEQALETQKSIIINHLNRGEPDKAFAELRPAMQKFPDNVDLKTLMGLTQLALRNPRNAVKFLKEANEQDSNSTTVLNLSSAYIENGQNVAALKLLKKHIKSGDLTEYQYPERIYHNVGLAYLRLKKSKGAMINFRKALDQNPKFYLSLMQIGDLYSKKSNHKTARKFYRKALPACGNCFEAVQVLSKSYLSEGNRNGAGSVLKSYASNKKLPNELRVKAQKLIAELQLTPRNNQTAKAGPAKPRDQAPQKRN